MRRASLMAVAFLISILSCARPTMAQGEIPTTVTLQNRTGELPFSTSIGSSIEHVDAATGTLNVRIPLTNIEERGMKSGYYLQFNSNYFVLAPRTNSLGNPYYIWTLPLHALWQTNHPYKSSVSTRLKCDNVGSQNEGYATTTNAYMYVDDDGAKHPLAIQIQSGFCAGPNDNVNPDLTGDGMSATTQAVTLANGTVISNLVNYQYANWEDQNGNEKSWATTKDGTGAETNTTVDTLGRNNFTTQATVQSNGFPIQTQYTFLDSSGSPQTYTINWQNINFATAFGTVTYGYGSTVELSTPYYAISSVVYPNGQTYTFKYDTTGYGEISEIDLPTGGVITYQYANLANSLHSRRYVASRTETVGGVSSTWTFAIATTSAPHANLDQYTTTVSYPPVGNPLVTNQTVYTSANGQVTDAKIYAGSAQGTPLREYQLIYAVDSDPYADDACYNPQSLPLPPLQPQPVGERLTRITTILENGQQSKKEYDYETFTYVYHPNHCTFKNAQAGDSNVAKTYTTSRGNVTEIREYDWGQGAPGALIRRTDNVYGLNSNSNYLPRNIVDKITQQTIYDGAGNQIAQTQYEYDNYVAGQNALISTSGAQAPQHDYTNYGATFIYRGNATRVKKWRNTDGAYLTTTYTYDDLGNIRAVQDPLSHTSTYTYTDAWANASCPPVSGNGQAYVTLFSNPLSQQVKLTYFPCTGLKQSRADQNDINASRTGTVYTYDLLGRQTIKIEPDGGQTATAYNDTPPVSITSTTKISSTSNLVNVFTMDGLGRQVQSQLTSDPQGAVIVDTTYDALGRMATISNPYRSGSDPTSSPGTTSYAYDALGRKVKETAQDGAVTQTAYCGSSTLVTDPVGKWRRSNTDGLGRLIEVDEPNAVGATVNANGCPGSGEPIWITSYSYDVLGNLKQVLQNGSRQRTFSYDSLSHLLTSANPETGTITYAYDNDANVATKLDARGITATYGHDALDRLSSITYSNSDPAISIHYDETNCLALAHCDNIGHRTSATDAAGSEAWSFDVADRMDRDQRTIVSTPSNITKPTTYSYDYNDNVISISYPSNRIVNYAFDAANRPSSATDGTNGFKYLTGLNSIPANSGCATTTACYTAQNMPYGFTLGQTSTFTGLGVTHTYNSRLQPLEFKASSTAGNAADITYSFVDPVSLKDAGHVYGIANNLDTTRSQSFSYDQVNRVSAAQTSSTHATSPAHCWGEIYNIDVWGNLQSIAATTNTSYTGCTVESGFSQTADASNHLSGFGYDASGNTTSDGINSYLWNAENQLKSGGGVTYLYDVDGQRRAKVGSKLYWYGPSGEVISETDTTGHTTADYVFFGGKRIVTQATGGQPVLYVEDELGTSRITTTSGGVVCYDADFYPYGGERAYVNTCPQNYKFEDKERDGETGNDDFGARYYSNRFGRWLSSDWSTVPVAIPYANLSNPQTLNLYGLAGDDPESFADLDGHCFPLCAGLALAGGGTIETITAISLTSNPVGWGILAVGAIGVGGYVIYQHYHQGGVPASPPPTVSTQGQSPSPPPTVATQSQSSSPPPSVSQQGVVSNGAVNSSLPNDANVVRGGENKPENFTNGSGVTTDSKGNLQGVSVNSAPGKSVGELSQGIRNGKVGSTTVGDIRKAGGQVTPAPTAKNPDHCIMCGISAEKASSLMDVQPNPAKSPTPQ